MHENCGGQPSFFHWLQVSRGAMNLDLSLQGGKDTSREPVTPVEASKQASWCSWAAGRNSRNILLIPKSGFVEDMLLQPINLFHTVGLLKQA